MDKIKKEISNLPNFLDYSEEERLEIFERAWERVTKMQRDLNDIYYKLLNDNYEKYQKERKKKTKSRKD